jgi:uncharacterized protein involved in propanediol utilization
VTDFSAQVQNPGLAGVAPTYNQCTAADKFKASPGAKYLLHYKNGATPATAVKITDQTTQIPVASGAAAGFADAIVAATIGASAEYINKIDNSSRFMDGQGYINLQATTPTTLTVAIIGPL